MSVEREGMGAARASGAHRQPLRWGLLSTASINSRFLQAARSARIADVTAVASRSAEKAHAYAAAHGIGGAHGTYEALLEDPTVDAVYISLPNSLHVEWTIRALEAGKHVLCEKPFSADPDAVRRAFAVAASRGRVLMEALMWRHSPLAARLVELVEGGAIGRPALFTFILTNPPHDPADPRLDVELAGGALADLGCYAVHAFRHLVGEPTTFSAQALGDGVDTRFAAVLATEAGDALGTFICGFGLALQWDLRVVGDEGWLAMPDRWTRPEVSIELHRPDGRTVIGFSGNDPYVDQLINFTDAVAGAEAPLLGEEDAVSQARALRALYGAAAATRSLSGGGPTST